MAQRLDDIIDGLNQNVALQTVEHLSDEVIDLITEPHMIDNDPILNENKTLEDPTLTYRDHFSALRDEDLLEAVTIREFTPFTKQDFDSKTPIAPYMAVTGDLDGESDHTFDYERIIEYWQQKDLAVARLFDHYLNSARQAELDAVDYFGNELLKHMAIKPHISQDELFPINQRMIKRIRAAVYTLPKLVDELEHAQTSFNQGSLGQAEKHLALVHKYIKTLPTLKTSTIDEGLRTFYQEALTYSENLCKQELDNKNFLRASQYFSIAYSYTTALGMNIPDSQHRLKRAFDTFTILDVSASDRKIEDLFQTLFRRVPNF